MYDAYDYGLSPIGGLTIWFFIIVVSCMVLFVTIRKAVKVNELLAVQNRILRQLELQSEILSGDYTRPVSSIYLDEIRQWSIDDVIAKGGIIVSHPKVEAVAKLYNNFMDDVGRNGGSILSAKKLFKVELDRIISKMDASQKEVFLKIYSEQIG
ncbi:hypothetical protein PTR28_05870 [Serratia marcescens]|uniref:hypothetical protein n=1 Tax=Serratia marcescens TaxID=615 RepID=UPI0029D204E1|nr:hypothetical protein [Serratia marcescens]HEJ7311815.1 hypothetical protein [Serratia marcescens]